MSPADWPRLRALLARARAARRVPVDRRLRLVLAWTTPATESGPRCHLLPEISAMPRHIELQACRPHRRLLAGRRCYGCRALHGAGARAVRRRAARSIEGLSSRGRQPLSTERKEAIYGAIGKLALLLEIFCHLVFRFPSGSRLNTQQVRNLLLAALLRLLPSCDTCRRGDRGLHRPSVRGQQAEAGRSTSVTTATSQPRVQPPGCRSGGSTRSTAPDRRAGWQRRSLARRVGGARAALP